MWQEAQLVAHHPKWPGIVGDSLTFAGAILLALEALFKPAENVSIGRKATIINYFKYTENAERQKLDLADGPNIPSRLPANAKSLSPKALSMPSISSRATSCRS